MSVTDIQDLRWGDTGKGKISSYLSQPEFCDVSVRSVGGGNAGHQIRKGALHRTFNLLPAGAIYPGVDVVLGRGMVTHTPTLFRDLEKAQEFTGPNEDLVDRMIIDGSNHILFDAHKRIDGIMEGRRSNDPIGTTKSGIGPAYADKAYREGMRFADLLKTPDQVKERFQKLLKHWEQNFGITLSEEEETKHLADLLFAKSQLERCIKPDLTEYWRNKFNKMARVVIEGAQGTLLSTNHEGYPYVTSSPTTVAGHMDGAGIPLRELTKVIGTFKAYDTRVGSGPMRTEMDFQESEYFRNKGGERGSTTGRNRRVGWLDLEDLKKRVWAESVDELAMLKADILDNERPVRIATETYPNGQPSYHSFLGWEDTSGLRNYDALHSNLKAYIELIERDTEVPVRYIGTGPESEELIIK